MDQARRSETDPKPDFEHEKESEPVFEEESEPVFEAEEDWERSGHGRPEAGYEDQSLEPEPVFTPAAGETGRPGAATGPAQEPGGQAGTTGDRMALLRPRSKRQLGRTSPFWVIGGIVLALVVVTAVWAISFRDRDVPTDENPVQDVAGEPGSVVLLPEAVETPPPTPEPTATPVVPLQVGQRVVVGNTSNQGIRLRADAGLESVTQEIYLDGRIFEVLEPGDGYAGYPVNKDGYEWYRIRVADDPEDQLVGWTVRDYLSPVDSAE
jgi:hypothetical protein